MDGKAWGPWLQAGAKDPSWTPTTRPTLPPASARPCPLCPSGDGPRGPALTPQDNEPWGRRGLRPPPGPFPRESTSQAMSRLQVGGHHAAQTPHAQGVASHLLPPQEDSAGPPPSSAPQAWRQAPGQAVVLPPPTDTGSCPGRARPHTQANTDPPASQGPLPRRCSGRPQAERARGAGASPLVPCWPPAARVWSCRPLMECLPSRQLPLPGTLTNGSGMSASPVQPRKSILMHQLPPAPAPTPRVPTARAGSGSGSAPTWPDLHPAWALVSPHASGRRSTEPPELLGHVTLRLPRPSLHPTSPPQGWEGSATQNWGSQGSDTHQREAEAQEGLAGPSARHRALGTLCCPHPQPTGLSPGARQHPGGTAGGGGDPADPGGDNPGAREARAEALGHTDPFLQSRGRSRQPGGPSGTPSSASCSLGRGLHLNELSPDRGGLGPHSLPGRGQWRRRPPLCLATTVSLATGYLWAATGPGSWGTQWGGTGRHTSAGSDGHGAFTPGKDVAGDKRDQVHSQDTAPPGPDTHPEPGRFRVGRESRLTRPRASPPLPVTPNAQPRHWKGPHPTLCQHLRPRPCSLPGASAQPWGPPTAEGSRVSAGSAPQPGDSARRCRARVATRLGNRWQAGRTAGDSGPWGPLRSLASGCSGAGPAPPGQRRDCAAPELSARPPAVARAPGPRRRALWDGAHGPSRRHVQPRLPRFLLPLRPLAPRPVVPPRALPQPPLPLS